MSSSRCAEGRDEEEHDLTTATKRDCADDLSSTATDATINISTTVVAEVSAAGAPHETDDIADILLGAGRLSGLSGASVLSASAKEFTPGGGTKEEALLSEEAFVSTGKERQHVTADTWDGVIAYRPGEDDVGDATAYEQMGDTGEMNGNVESSTVEDDGGKWDVGDEMHAAVQLQAELLEIMADTFSDCSPDCLQVALAKSDWDLDRASAAVLSALQAACDPDRPTKPCRHLLSGECLRRDCVFSHDFATTTCRYWLQSQCLNGDACHFKHDLDVLVSKTDGGVFGEVEQNTTAPRTTSPPALEMTDHFPSLECKKPKQKLDFKAKLKPPNSATPATVTVGSSSQATDRSASSTISSNADVVGNFGPILPTREEMSKVAVAATGPADAAQPPAVELQRHDETKNGEGDFLLAAAVSAAKHGGGRRKGGGKGRGRKTRFSAVSIQALMNGTPPDTSHDRDICLPASQQQQQAQSPSITAMGTVTSTLPTPPLPPNPWSSSNSQPSSRASWSDSPNDFPPSGSTKIRTKDGAAENVLLVGVPSEARISNGASLSFADIVGSTARNGTTTSSGNRSRGGGNPGVGVGGDVEAASPALTGIGGTAGAGLGVGVRGGGRERSKGSSGSLGWVSTGEAVSAQYQAARKEAAELARARNKLFMAATEAFRRGQGMSARDLARRGREINVRMKDKHREAAGHIFSSRNPGDQVFARRSMDLHGLHVSEAVAVLDHQLAALSERGIDRVRVLTGSGHHSKGPTSKARLVPAVENYCQSRGIPYQRVADQGTGHIGVIDISLVATVHTCSSAAQEY